MNTEPALPDFTEVLRAIRILRGLPDSPASALELDFDLPKPFLAVHEVFGTHWKKDEHLFKCQDEVFAPSSLELTTKQEWGLGLGIDPATVVFAQENQAVWVAIVKATTEKDPSASVVWPIHNKPPKEEITYSHLSLLLGGLLLETTQWKLPTRWSIQAPFREHLWRNRGFLPLLEHWQPPSAVYQTGYWWREADGIYLGTNQELDYTQLKSTAPIDLNILWEPDEEVTTR